MENLITIINLLGEENAIKLKDGITGLLLEQIRTDLENIDAYFLDPDDFTDMLQEAIAEAKQETKELVKLKLMEKALKELDKLSI